MTNWSRHLLWILALGHIAPARAASEKPTTAVEVPAVALDKIGYWQKVFDKKCNVEMMEAHGENAALSLIFVGSGIVARFLRCPECSKVEVKIDKANPVIVDLSSGGRECAQESPAFVKTDLKHKKHTITITRLDPAAPLKVLQFEYLTHDPPRPPPSTDGGPQATFSVPGAEALKDAAAGDMAKKVAKGVVKYAARQVAYQAATALLSFGAIAAVRMVAGPVIRGMFVPDVPVADMAGGVADDPGNLLGDDGGAGFFGDDGIWDEPIDAPPIGDDGNWLDSIIEGLGQAGDWLTL